MLRLGMVSLAGGPQPVRVRGRGGYFRTSLATAPLTSYATRPLFVQVPLELLPQSGVGVPFHLKEDKYEEDFVDCRGGWRALRARIG